MDCKKVKVYIDGANVFYTQKRLGWVIDWSKVKDFIAESKEVLEWKYYVGIKRNDQKMQKYLRYLDAINFNLFTKYLKKIKTGDNSFVYKANLDVEMTTDILLDKSNLDQIIIFSGDSDFNYLVKKIKSIGRDVVVFSSRKTLSWELKLKASKVVYLEDIKGKIARE